ncbi:RecX family transcriptional regulator [Terrabacter sp. 2RAF25]|uniref:regulatory protein RecX n=1 Tax=Terrabacter sp. 2RAF25 TaxID=3232998 RepID=UPI003F952831
MAGPAHESTEDRLARAAAALAEAQGVVEARAAASEGPSPSPRKQGRAGAASASEARPRRARSGRERGARPRSGWAAADPGDGPDWALPPQAAGSGAVGATGEPIATGVAADAGESRGWAPPPDDTEAEAPEADAESVARAIVLRQLSMAPRSRVQLERKLRQRGCDGAVAAKVLDRMTEVGLVDDEAYAQMLVRSRQAGKGLARRALAHELRKQGIDQDVADEALGQVGAGDERVRAEALVAKKLRSMRGLPPEVQARRLAGMLARKGYSGEVAWPVIRAGVDGLPEHRRD